MCFSDDGTVYTFMYIVFVGQDAKIQMIPLFAWVFPAHLFFSCHREVRSESCKLLTEYLCDRQTGSWHSASVSRRDVEWILMRAAWTDVYAGGNLCVTEQEAAEIHSRTPFLVCLARPVCLSLSLTVILFCVLALYWYHGTVMVSNVNILMYIMVLQLASLKYF